MALLAGFRAVALRLDLLAFGALMAATMAWERHVTLLRLGRLRAGGEVRGGGVGGGSEMWGGKGGRDVGGGRGC